MEGKKMMIVGEKCRGYVRLGFVVFSVCCFIWVSTIGSGATENKAYQIVKKVADKESPNTAVANLEIRNISPDGEQEIQEAVILVKIDDKKNRKGRAILRFLFPLDMKGTIVFQQREGNKSEIYVFIPALSKWRKVPPKSESFFGSELTYEDVMGRDIDENEYELLEEKGDLYIIKAIPLTQASYDYYVLTIDKEYNIRQVDFIKDGKNFKVMKVKNIQKIQGFDTITESSVENLLTGRKSEMKLKKVEYNVNIPEKYFDVKVK
jgi:hypothetical protein